MCDPDPPDPDEDGPWHDRLCLACGEPGALADYAGVMFVLCATCTEFAQEAVMAYPGDLAPAGLLQLCAARAHGALS